MFPFRYRFYFDDRSPKPGEARLWHQGETFGTCSHEALATLAMKMSTPREHNPAIREAQMMALEIITSSQVKETVPHQRRNSTSQKTGGSYE